MALEILTQEENQLWLKEAVKIKKQLNEALNKGDTTVNELVSMLASINAYDKITGFENAEQKINVKNAILGVNYNE